MDRPSDLHKQPIIKVICKNIKITNNIKIRVFEKIKQPIYGNHHISRRFSNLHLYGGARYGGEYVERHRKNQTYVH